MLDTLRPGILFLFCVKLLDDIPFASGRPITLIPPDGIMGGVAALIGFGTSSSTSLETSFLTGTDLTKGAGQELNMACSAPRSGTIESISGYFSTTQAFSVPFNTLNIIAQLYKSSVPDNVFAAIPGASVYFGYTGTVPIGSIGHGITENLNIQVNTQL
jgi:BclB C-terminal domain-containing protein